MTSSSIPAVIAADPDQARVEVADCRQPPWLDGVGHGDDLRLADAVLARGAGELDVLHTAKLLQGTKMESSGLWQPKWQPNERKRAVTDQRARRATSADGCPSRNARSAA